MSYDAFGKKNEEKADLNQLIWYFFWYSPYTIRQIVEEVLIIGGKTALNPTPSIYFSIPEEVRSNCYVLDFDRGFATDPRYVLYDFNAPDQLPSELLHEFDNLVIDPPFITEEVWRKYAATAKLLLKPNGGKVILTTINENKDLLQELFSAQPTAFLPSIPNLVYQYNLYTNYESTTFSKVNPEIPI